MQRNLHGRSVNKMMKMRNHKRRIGTSLNVSTYYGALSILVLCTLVGCGGTRVEIPKPTDRLAPPPPPPHIEESIIHLKVSVPVNDLAFAADAAVPREAGQEDTWRDVDLAGARDRVHYQYHFIRGPLNLRMVGDQLALELPENLYRLAVRMDRPDGDVQEVRCGYGQDGLKRLRLAATSKLNWTDKWTLASETSFDPPEFLDRCNTLEGMNFDATRILEPLVNARLRALAERIDAKVRERSQARKRAETIWRKLQQPVPLTSELWLNLNPVGAKVSPIGSDDSQNIRTSVNLILKPQAYFGPQTKVNERPMPPLELTPISQDGFHLAVPVLAGYGDINRRLEQRLVGQEIGMSVDQRLKILSVQTYGSGDRLILALGVSGAVNGKIYAVGKPVIETISQTLTFKQFDFTVDTKDALMRAAGWLVHDDILFQIKPYLDIDLSGQIEGLRQQLAATLNRELHEGIWLEGTVTSAEPRSIYLMPGGVEVLVVADGLIQLSVR
jgi:hypothetical protein